MPYSYPPADHPAAAYIEPGLLEYPDMLPSVLLATNVAQRTILAKNPDRTSVHVYARTDESKVVLLEIGRMYSNILWIFGIDHDLEVNDEI